MKLEDIAVEILVNSNKYHDKDRALEGLKSEFSLHFPASDYAKWNTEVPESLAKNIIPNVGKNENVSVKFIIKDLEVICKTI
jgi:hypothetical protein